MTLHVPESLRETPVLSDELYRHAKRPEWGLGILVADEGDRRAYRFEDGMIRKFKEGYYEFLEPIREFKGFGATRARLVEAETADEAKAASGKRTTLEAVCTLQDQVRLFKTMYPGGFRGSAWQAKMRGDAEGASSKRHRSPTIEAARRALTPVRCRTLVDEGRHSELMTSIVELFAETDLVPPSHVKALRSLTKDDTRTYVEATVNLVAHEPEMFGLRYREYLWMLRHVFGKRPSWRVATALMAVARPAEHVCVRRSALLRQAALIAPRSVYTRKPRLHSYLAFLEVATTLRDELEAMGLAPADLLDVYDFVWTTLRKSALPKLRAAA